MNVRHTRTFLLSASVCLLVLTTAIVPAQTTLSNGEYGAVVTRMGQIRNTAAVFIGGEGGWNLDRSFAVGIEGYALLSDINARVPDTSGNHFLTMSYGGGTVGYTLPIGGVFDLTFHGLIGGGAIGHKENPYLDRRQYHDPFFIFEPGLNFELVVARIFRLGAGASYRTVAFLRSDLASQSELSGPSAFVSVKVEFF